MAAVRTLKNQHQTTHPLWTKSFSSNLNISHVFEAEALLMVTTWKTHYDFCRRL